VAPPNKGDIFKREGNIVYHLNFIHDAYRPKVGHKLPKEVVNFSCVPYPIVGWSLEGISFRGGGYLASYTNPHIGHRGGHAYLKLGLQGLNPQLVGFYLGPTSFEFLLLSSFG